MPGQDGLLTAEDQKKIADWINAKGKNHHCPVCSENNWNIMPHLLTGMIFHPGGAFVVGGPSYPVAVVICNNCFYLRHFLAIPLGVIAAEDGGANGQ